MWILRNTSINSTLKCDRPCSISVNPKHPASPHVMPLTCPLVGPLHKDPKWGRANDLKKLNPLQQSSIEGC